MAGISETCGKDKGIIMNHNQMSEEIKQLIEEAEQTGKMIFLRQEYERMFKSSPMWPDEFIKQWRPAAIYQSRKYWELVDPYEVKMYLAKTITKLTAKLEIARTILQTLSKRIRQQEKGM